jgi:hypothetical protein
MVSESKIWMKSFFNPPNFFYFLIVFIFFNFNFDQQVYFYNILVNKIEIKKKNCLKKSYIYIYNGSMQ